MTVWVNFFKKNSYSIFLWFYSIFAGFLLAFSIAPKFFKGLEWFGLVLFLGLLYLPMKKNRDLFFFGWLSGFIAFGVYFSWFFEAVPLTYLGISNIYLNYFLIFYLWFISAGFGAIFFGLFLITIKNLAFNFYQQIIFIILLWPIFEYLRTLSLFIHLLLAGKGTIFGDNVGVMLLGYAVADYNSLRALASFLGIYGLSIVVLIPNLIFLIILFEKLLPFYFHKNFNFNFENKAKSLREILFGLTVLTVVFLIFVFIGNNLYNKTPYETRRVKVAAFQTNIPPENIRDNLVFYGKVKPEIEEKFKMLLNQNPEVDIVVMPHGLPPLFYFFPTVLPISQPMLLDNNLIKEKIGNNKYRLVFAAMEPEKANENDFYDVFGLYDNSNGFLGEYRKRFLMPWGDYLPEIFRWLAKIFASPQWRENYLSNGSYIPGDHIGVFETKLGKVGTLICSEAFSPQLMEHTAQAGAEIILIAGSDGMLRGSKLLSQQYRVAIQTFAAEIKKPIVMAMNLGSSLAVDSRGNVIFQKEPKSENIKIIDVSLNDDKAFAVRYRNWLIYSFIFIFLVIITFNTFSRKNSQDSQVK